MNGRSQGLVELWTFDLDVPRSYLSKLTGYCTDEERERAQQFRLDIHRERFLACRGRVRQILADYVRRSPEQLLFKVHAWGKPYLDHSGVPLRFNVSHCEDIGVLAVTHDYDIGIDLEVVRPIETSVAREFFSENERAYLSNLTGARWLEAFFQCWTRKEAFLKTIGTGLQTPLDSFSVPLGDLEKPERILTSNSAPLEWRDMRLLHLNGPRGTIGAVCVNCGNQPVLLRILPHGHSSHGSRVIAPPLYA